MTVLVMLILVAGIAFSVWTAFNMGRGLAAPGLGVVRDVRVELKDRIEALEAERDDLLQKVASLERDSQIEREAAREVRRSLIGVQNERLELKEEIALLNSLLSDGKNKAGLRVRRFELESLDVPGSFRYRFALSKLPQDDQELQATLDLSVTGQQEGGEKTLGLKEMTDGKHPEPMVFKQLIQVEGTLQLPEGFVPERVKIVIKPKKDDVMGVERELAWVVGS